MLRIDVDSVSLGRTVRACFDTADWRDIASMEDLTESDIYFKRGYHPGFLHELPSSLRKKIVPMGLHYGCSSRNESVMQCFARVLARNAAPGAFTQNPLNAIGQTFATPLKQALKKAGLVKARSDTMFIDDFEVEPDAPAEPMVFYRTRVYGPTDAPDNFRLGRMEEVNELRVNTVRALRAHFGDRFVGGLRHSAFAQQRYADCLFQDDQGLRGHLKASRECLVNVNTAGLHDSTSWKVAEYMAASRCIVSEPMTYETPEPVLEGKHYLGFTTPDECVAACERLFDAPDFAAGMRKNNFDYYCEFVRPDRLMYRSLRTLTDRSQIEHQRETK